MNKERLITVLLSLCVSEKTTALQEKRQYAFKVRTDATKKEVMASVKEMFKVDVEKVRICNVKGGIRNFGRTQGRVKDWKKAYVTLKDGFAINLEVA